MPDKTEHVDRLEMVRSFLGHEDNLRIWGQLYASRTGLTVGGWLLNSWSELGAPYWNPELHWLDKGENKIYHAYLDLDRRAMNLHSEDTNIDPKRATFIQKMTEKWEFQWLQDQADHAQK